jgi:hypothetical protein
MRFVLTFALLLVLGVSASAQEFPQLDKSPLDVAYFPTRVAFRNFAKTDAEKNAQPVARAIYSRPQKNGRNVFGELVKFGSVWRLGANEATEVEFFEDVNIGDQRVKAGRYTLYATINEADWNVVFSTDLDVWGAYAYDEKHDVASISVPTEKTDATVEAFTILFKEVEGGAHMIMAWDDTMVQVPIMW